MGNRGFFGFSHTEPSYISLGAFFPMGISGLKIWYSADTIFNKNDGDAVDRWVDQTFQVNDATQVAGASQPVYKVNIINGLPVLRFDGSDDYMTGPLLPVLTGVDFTLFATYAFRATNVQQVAFRDPPNTSGGTCIVGYTSNNTGFYRLNDTSMGLSTNLASELGTNPRITTMIKSGTDGAVYRDATLRVSTTVSGSLLVADTMIYGRNSDAASSYAQIDFAEFMLYDRALNIDEQSLVHTYLKTKWGIV